MRSDRKPAVKSLNRFCRILISQFNVMGTCIIFEEFSAFTAWRLNTDAFT